MHAITFEFCDFNKTEHQQALTSLLNHYMSDPMGNHPLHDENKQQLLLKGLSNHPTAFVLFLLYDGRYTGMATCFVNYSSFKLKPYLYVHDVVVCKEHRSKGFGKALIQKLVGISKERNYCKITLEVREDNPAAQSVYRSIGFEECEPRMLFWEKQL